MTSQCLLNLAQSKSNSLKMKRGSPYASGKDQLHSSPFMIVCVCTQVVDVLLFFLLRVMNVLKTWFTEFSSDFMDNRALFEELKRFVDTQLSLTSNMRGLLLQLRAKMEEAEKEKRDTDFKFSKKPPKTVVSRRISKSKPTDIDLKDLESKEVMKLFCNTHTHTHSDRHTASLFMHY